MRRYIYKRDDDGVALVASIGVIMLIGIIMLTVVAYALRETRQTGRDRQRSSAVMTAEGQVDVTLARIQSAAPAALPCDDTIDATSASPDVHEVRTVVTYYSGNAAVDCSTARGGAVQVTQALVQSTAVSQPIAGQASAQRTMETLINLTPAVTTGLDKAIFGDQGIELANRGEIFGQDGKPDADMYTNGDVNCDNNQHYHGSIYAQGTINLASTCRVDVDAWAKEGFNATNTGVTVSGRVLVSDGDAAITKNASVAGTVRASGSITWEGCPETKCFPYSTVDAPPTYEFPQLNWDEPTRLEWYDAGYTTVIDGSVAPEVEDCTVSGSGNGPGRWMMANADKLLGPTILRTTCKVVLQKNGNLVPMSNDLAVFADGGFSFSNSLTIRSTDTTQRRLHLVQPYNAVAYHPCTEDGIVLDNRVTVESTVDLLLYTPCSIKKRNNSDHYGQIYGGGHVVIENALTMYYRPLPVWGVKKLPETVKSYSLDILYKRENAG